MKRQPFCFITGLLFMAVVYIMIALVFGVSVPHTKSSAPISINPKPRTGRLSRGQTDRIIKTVVNHPNATRGPEVDPGIRKWTLGNITVYANED